jgi:tricorn protease
MKLGPLIGKRTWGGVIGIWPRHSLVDGGVTTQPEFSFWFKDIGWQVENYGVEPDIEVEYRPQDYVAGVDPQLQRGVNELMKQLERHPRSVQFPPPPSRAWRRKITTMSDSDAH